MKVVTICRDLLTPVVSIHYAPRIGFPRHENTPLEGLLAAGQAELWKGSLSLLPSEGWSFASMLLVSRICFKAAASS